MPYLKQLTQSRSTFYVKLDGADPAAVGDRAKSAEVKNTVVHKGWGVSLINMKAKARDFLSTFWDKLTVRKNPAASSNVETENPVRLLSVKPIAEPLATAPLAVNKAVEAGEETGAAGHGDIEDAGYSEVGSGSAFAEALVEESASCAARDTSEDLYTLVDFSRSGAVKRMTAAQIKEGKVQSTMHRGRKLTLAPRAEKETPATEAPVEQKTKSNAEAGNVKRLIGLIESRGASVAPALETVSLPELKRVRFAEEVVFIPEAKQAKARKSKRQPRKVKSQDANRHAKKTASRNNVQLQPSGMQAFQPVHGIEDQERTVRSYSNAVYGSASEWTMEMAMGRAKENDRIRDERREQGRKEMEAYNALQAQKSAQIAPEM